MRTLLYFGSFNPIHIGHLAIANYAMISEIADELWFVVSPQNPFKEADSLVSAEHRIAMVRRAVESSELDRISVSDIELRLPTPSYTIQTLEALRAEFPDREFAILMGSDNLAEIDQWKNHTKILNEYKIYIYNRCECHIKKDLYNNKSIIPLKDTPSLSINSTQLRTWLAEEKTIPALLPNGVYKYIKTHGLYRINR